MRLKPIHFLSVCVATFGLLIPPAIASAHNIKSQQITELELLKVERENIRGNDTQKNLNQQKPESMQSISVANHPRTTRFYPSSARPLDKNSSFLALIIMTNVIISFILLEIWYQNYQKQRHKQEAEIEQGLIEREKQIETLERIWKINA